MNSSDRHFIVRRTGTIVRIREVEPGSCSFTLSRRDAWDRALQAALPAKRSSDPKRREPAEIAFIGLDAMTTIVQTRQATQAMWEQINATDITDTSPVAEAFEGLPVSDTPAPAAQPAWIDQDPSHKAVIDDLRAQDDAGRGNDFTTSLLDYFDRNGRLSDKQRDAVLRGIAKRDEARSSGPMPEVPAGRYAVENEEGILRFYRVDRPEDGKWAGYTFVKVMASDEEHPVRGTAAKAILAKIAVDPLAAMKRYGHEIGSCGKCGRTLTDPASIADGIGPVCAAGL